MRSFNVCHRLHRALLRGAPLLALVCASLQAGEVRSPQRPLAPAAGHLAPTHLSLKEAQEIAIQSNWDLIAAKARVDLAIAQTFIAREFPNPTFSYSSTNIQTSRLPNSTSDGNKLWQRNYDTTLAIEQLFEVGGKRASKKAAAAAGRKEAEANYADACRTLALGVSKAYTVALLAEAKVTILKQSAESLRREADISEARLTAGDISVVDRNQIELEAERVALEVATAQAEATAAHIELEVLLGNPKPQGAWIATDSLDTLASALKPGADSRPRPDVLAAEAAVTKANADLRLEKANRVPDPSLFLQYERQPTEAPHTVGFGVSFPLPLWNRNNGAIRGAKAARDEAAALLGKARTQALSEVATAEAAYRNALFQWRHYTVTILPKSQQVLKAITFAYQKGDAPMIALLTAQRDDNEVRMNAVQAMADTAAAAAELAAARNSSAYPSTLPNTSPRPRHEKNR